MRVNWSATAWKKKKSNWRSTSHWVEATFHANLLFGANLLWGHATEINKAHLAARRRRASWKPSGPRRAIWRWVVNAWPRPLADSLQCAIATGAEPPLPAQCSQPYKASWMQTHGDVTRRLCKYADWRKRKKKKKPSSDSEMEVWIQRMRGASATIQSRPQMQTSTRERVTDAAWFTRDSRRSARATATETFHQLHATCDKVRSPRCFRSFLLAEGF